MYAIFQSGGKQYKVHEGQIVRLEKLNTGIGEIIEFNEILLVVKNKEIKIGIPFVEDVSIKAKVFALKRNKKVKIVKFRRRKHCRKKQGHRQWFTDVKIISINN